MAFCKLCQKFSVIGQLLRNKPIIMTPRPRTQAPPTNSLATRLHDIINQNLVGRHGIITFLINTKVGVYTTMDPCGGWVIDSCAHLVQWHENKLNTPLVSTFHSHFMLSLSPRHLWRGARSVWGLNCFQWVIFVAVQLWLFGTSLISSQSLISHTSKYKRLSRLEYCTVTQLVLTRYLPPRPHEHQLRSEQ